MSTALSTFGPTFGPAERSKYRWKVQRLPVPAHVRLPSWRCSGVPQRHFKTGPLEPCTLFEIGNLLIIGGVRTDMPCMRWPIWRRTQKPRSSRTLGRRLQNPRLSHLRFSGLIALAYKLSRLAVIAASLSARARAHRENVG